MDLEQLSERLQIVIAQLQEAGVKHVDRCNLYLTPVDGEGAEVHVWGNKKKPIKEIAIKTETDERLDKLTIIQKDR